MGRACPFNDSCPTAASRKDHVALALALAAHGAEVVDPARDEPVVRRAHGRVTRTADELTGLKADGTSQLRSKVFKEGTYPRHRTGRESGG
jgi:hypothetical protein